AGIEPHVEQVLCTRTKEAADSGRIERRHRIAAFGAYVLPVDVRLGQRGGCGDAARRPHLANARRLDLDVDVDVARMRRETLEYRIAKRRPPLLERCSIDVGRRGDGGLSPTGRQRRVMRRVPWAHDAG